MPWITPTSGWNVLRQPTFERLISSQIDTVGMGEEMLLQHMDIVPGASASRKSAIGQLIEFNKE